MIHCDQWEVCTVQSQRLSTPELQLQRLAHWCACTQESAAWNLGSKRACTTASSAAQLLTIPQGRRLHLSPKGRRDWGFLFQSTTQLIIRLLSVTGNTSCTIVLNYWLQLLQCMICALCCSPSKFLPPLSIQFLDKNMQIALHIKNSSSGQREFWSTTILDEWSGVEEAEIHQPSSKVGIRRASFSFAYWHIAVSFNCMISGTLIPQCNIIMLYRRLSTVWCWTWLRAMSTCTSKCAFTIHVYEYLKLIISLLLWYLTAAKLWYEPSTEKINSE